MKITELREMSVEALEQEIEKARKELFECRFKHSTRQLENTARMRILKHRIAQALTVVGEKQRAVGGRKK